MSVVFLKMDICVITYFIIHCCHIIVIIYSLLFYCFSNTFAKVRLFIDITKLFVLNGVKRIILFMVRIDLFLFSNINII